MKLSTSLHPDDLTEPILHDLPGIAGVQQILPRLKHDSGKSAAGSSVDVIRTPYTIFRSIYQLIFNIEILIRYKYNGSVYDMNAIHKYVEYLMLAIRKDISFYGKVQADLLDEIKHIPEEIKQVNETFGTLLSNVELIYNEKVKDLPESIVDYDLQFIKDDLTLDLPPHPLMDDNTYLDQNQMLDTEINYFHVLLFVMCNKITLRYYCCAQYMLCGYSNIKFSRSSNIDQIKRSMYSLIELCLPFHKLLQSDEFDVSQYEATYLLFKSNYKLPFTGDSNILNLVVQLKQAIAQFDLNTFLDVLNHCPFVLYTCAITFIPPLCLSWLDIHYKCLTPHNRDLQSFCKDLLPCLFNKHIDIESINLNMNPKLFIQFLSLIIRDQIYFCKSDLRSMYLNQLNAQQSEQKKELAKMNTIKYEKTSKATPMTNIPISTADWKSIPFYPQHSTISYKPIKYIIVGLFDVEIDLTSLLFMDYIKINTPHPWKIDYTCKIDATIAKAIKQSSAVKPSKSSSAAALLAKLNKSKKTRQMDVKNLSNDDIRTKGAVTTDAIATDEKLNDNSDKTDHAELSFTTFPHAKNYNPNLVESNNFSFLPFTTVVTDNVNDVEMEEASAMEEPTAIQNAPAVVPPTLISKENKGIQSFNTSAEPNPRDIVPFPKTLSDTSAKPPVLVPSFEFKTHSPHKIENCIKIQPPVTIFKYENIEKVEKINRIISTHRIFTSTNKEEVPKEKDSKLPNDNIFGILPEYDIFIPKRKRLAKAPKLEKKQKIIDKLSIKELEIARLIDEQDVEMDITRINEHEEMEIEELLKSCKEILNK